jgi:anti-anti-sigma factor
MTARVPREPMRVPLGIEVSFPSPGTTRLTVAGEIDLASAPTVRMRLLAVLSDHRPTIIEVDLGGVAFLDCSGIGMLVDVRNAAVRSECLVWICRAQPMPAAILDLVGLLESFTEPVPPSQLEARSPRRIRLARKAWAMLGRNVAA